MQKARAGNDLQRFREVTLQIAALTSQTLIYRLFLLLRMRHSQPMPSSPAGRASQKSGVEPTKENAVKSLIFRIRYRIALWRMGRMFGPYGKPPF